MKRNIKYLIIVILLLISVTSLMTYAYFTAKVIGNNEEEFKVNSGNLDLKIDDTSVSSLDISPIYDNDYEMLAYHKDFEVISNSSLNACASLYLKIDEISSSLKSEYFKYRIISEGIDTLGDFKSANDELMLTNNIFIEGKSTKYFDLYIWVSYQEDVDQMDMLGTKLDASLVVKAIDAKDRVQCK